MNISIFGMQEFIGQNDRGLWGPEFIDTRGPRPIEFTNWATREEANRTPDN